MASSELRRLLFLVPGDPLQKTGGYRYVSRLVSELNQRGLPALVEGLSGRFPLPDAEAESAMESALDGCEDGATVILDGLAMGALPEVVERHAGRLRLWSLVHHPLADETGLGDEEVSLLFDAETRALAAVAGVIVTSQHTALRLEDFKVPAHKMQVVEPGADTVVSASQALKSKSQSDVPQLLCVATLSPRKAQHQLVEALSRLPDQPWHCALVGSTERDRDYSQQIQHQIDRLNLNDRISLVGELGDESLAKHYRTADLFVLPSLYEGYGMVIDEALTAGLPVITSDGGALASTGKRPGVSQYPAGSVDDLYQCLESCLSGHGVLGAMAAEARQTATSARRWSDVAVDFAQALNIRIGNKDHSQFDGHWLTLREPADHRARNRALLERVNHWAMARTDADQNSTERLLRIVDLGAGAGSNGVFLSNSLDVPQHWTLLDQSESLLNTARSRLEPDVAGVEICECRLEASNLADQIQPATQLITASALIDLVSEPWLDAFAAVAETRRAGVYIVLSYAGTFCLNPEHPDDDFMRAQVNEHQHGHKGDGAALGPDATACLTSLLEARGFTVSVAPSRWELGDESVGDIAGDGELQAALIAGWCEAAVEQCPAEEARIRQWQTQRLAEAEQGSLKIRVDHEDLFARPNHD